jgi:PAS domain S-box-containing protein
VMAIREIYIETLIELFKSYFNSRGSLEAFEEVRFRANQLGKRFFKEKVPLDWVIGLYVEATRRLESEAQGEALEPYGCKALLLELVITYSINLLENLELEKQLRESEERFRRVAERSFDAILTWDTTGCITYASPAAERICGRKLEDLLGKPFHDLVHESSRPRAMRAHAEAMNGELVNGLQIDLVGGDGSSIAAEVNASAIISGGDVVGVEGIFRDITKHKRAEEALREYIEKFKDLEINKTHN